ncbi:class I SAM-dependent methyltransferase [Nocardiopsis composta]
MDSKAWDERYRATGLVWGAGPNRFVVEQTEGLAPGRALDLAAGEGRNAVWLAERGWRVTAVDFSPVAVERGRRIAAERGADVEWAAADVRAYTPNPAATTWCSWPTCTCPPRSGAGSWRTRCARWPPADGWSASATTGATSSTAPAARRTRRSCTTPRRSPPT